MIAHALRTEHLTKVYGSGAIALKDVSVDIPIGAFMAIIGHSGAGKSTFLRCLNAACEPTSGELQLNGRSYKSFSPRALRQSIALVPQNSNLVPQLSALQNVLIGRVGRITGWRSYWPIFGRHDKVLALEALDRVGLGAYANAAAQQLSGGQQQRVAIARALTQEACVVLADEPVASLDPENAQSVMQCLAEINRGSVTVVINLHQIELARQFCVSLLAFKAGRVVFNGQVNTFDSHEYQRVFAVAKSS